MRDRAAIPFPPPRRIFYVFPVDFYPFEQLLPLMIPVPPPRLGQAEHESGRVRLLGRMEGGFEFLADAARLGFHPA